MFHYYRKRSRGGWQMRSTFFILFLGMVVSICVMANACFRVPVQVVQYDNEPAITVAPVGKVFISPATATQPQTAVMNPQVKDPETVGPHPPKPQPIPPGGLDWLSVLLGAGSLAIPGLAVAKVLVDRVRTAVAVGTELVDKIQEVKAAHPAAKDSINETLSKNQSEEARKFVDKVKNKVKPKKPLGG
jgi:hypothetical protein